MNKNFEKLALFCVMFSFFIFSFNFAKASTTDGSVSYLASPGAFAWGENIGWINFGWATSTAATGYFRIQDSGVTGYAWSPNVGWINFGPIGANPGVTISAAGVLSGYAWNSIVGYINFTGVTIDSTGNFTGIATGVTSGRVVMNCASVTPSACNVSNQNYKVVTDYIPVNSRVVTPTPTPAPSGGGGGGGGGGGSGQSNFTTQTNNSPTINLPQNGPTVSPTSGGTLSSSGSSKFKPPLINFTKNFTKIGLNSQDVKILQRFLNDNGYFVDKGGKVGALGKETSIFGINTRNALLKFQKDAKLKATGFLDTATRTYINNIYTSTRSLIPSIPPPIAGSGIIPKIAPPKDKTKEKAPTLVEILKKYFKK